MYHSGANFECTACMGDLAHLSDIIISVELQSLGVAMGNVQVGPKHLKHKGIMLQQGKIFTLGSLPSALKYRKLYLKYRCSASLLQQEFKFLILDTESQKALISVMATTA